LTKKDGPPAPLLEGGEALGVLRGPACGQERSCGRGPDPPSPAIALHGLDCVHRPRKDSEGARSQTAAGLLTPCFQTFDEAIVVRRCAAFKGKRRGMRNRSVTGGVQPFMCHGLLANPW
jgi:hypothetical protein